MTIGCGPRASLPFEIREEDRVRMKQWGVVGVLTLDRTSGRETGKFQGQEKKERHQVNYTDDNEWNYPPDCRVI